MTGSSDYKPPTSAAMRHGKTKWMTRPLLIAQHRLYRKPSAG